MYLSTTISDQINLKTPTSNIFSHPVIPVVKLDNGNGMANLIEEVANKHQFVSISRKLIFSPNVSHGRNKQISLRKRNVLIESTCRRRGVVCTLIAISNS